ncbi:hypothetical protein MSKU3_1191 [Komagataeibacter oboediens]|nr:hypothetical protein MSKU3_1191 [Komagataeibacter oboediens]
MTGVVNSVSSWLTARPPTMAMPRGRRSSDPVPVPSIMGTAPSMAARVVMRMGLKRSRAAWRMDCSEDMPSTRSASSAKSIIMMAFFLTMPISSTSPMMPMTSSPDPVTHSASSAPIPAEGRVERMVMGWTKLSYRMPSTI